MKSLGLLILLILPVATLAQSTPDVLSDHEFISVRTSKFRALYQISNSVDTQLKIANPEDVEKFKLLPQEKRQIFLDKRREYLTLIAQAFSNSSIGRSLVWKDKGEQAIGNLYKTLAGVERPQVEESQVDPSGDPSMKQWIADQNILEGGGPWGVRAFPEVYRKAVEDFLHVIDQIFWRDCLNIVNHEEPRLFLLLQGITDAKIGNYGFFLGGGGVAEIAFDKENKKAEVRIFSHTEKSDPNPILNLNADMGVTLKVRAGYLTGKKIEPGEPVKGNIWSMPGVVAIFYGDRFGMAFHGGVNLLALSLLMGGGHYNLAQHAIMRTIGAPLFSVAQYWNKLLGKAVPAVLGGALEAFGKIHSVQTIYTERQVGPTLNIDYGPDSFLGSTLDWAKSWTKKNSPKEEGKDANGPIKRLGAFIEDHRAITCLNLSGALSNPTANP